MVMRSPVSKFALFGCALFGGPVLSAQQPTLNPGSKQSATNRRELVGIVRDPSGAAIEGATVEIKGASAGTNEKGAFQLWTGEIDTVTISIRRIGFAALSAQIAARNGQWDTVAVELEPTSQRLAAVTVTGVGARRANGLRDFEARRTIGNGLYITRDEIARRNSERTSDVLRGKRGISLVKLANGSFGARFALYSRSKAKCAPDLWIDGVWSRDTEVDEILASDIEAMELYETFSAVPFQFTPHGKTAPCGTIVIWTRVPGK
jgi:hypothetical protein